MRLVMLGTGPFAVPTLEALAASPHEVRARRHPPTHGPRRTGEPASAGGRIELGLEVWTPETVNLPESPSTPRVAPAPTCSSSATTAKSSARPRSPRPASAASTCTARCCPSIAAPPRCNGRSCTATPKPATRVIQMTPGLDAGPCLAQAAHADRSGRRRRPNSKRGLPQLGAESGVRVVDELAAGTAKPIEQNPAQASKAPRLTKEQGAIDWSRRAAEIKNQVRAVRPWPRAYTFWHRERSPRRCGSTSTACKLD